MRNFVEIIKRQCYPAKNPHLLDAVAVGASLKTTNPKPVIPGLDSVGHFFASA